MSDNRVLCQHCRYSVPKQHAGTPFACNLELPPWVVTSYDHGVRADHSCDFGKPKG